MYVNSSLEKCSIELADFFMFVIVKTRTNKGFYKKKYLENPSENIKNLNIIK